VAWFLLRGKGGSAATTVASDAVSADPGPIGLPTPIGGTGDQSTPGGPGTGTTGTQPTGAPVPYTGITSSSGGNPTGKVVTVVSTADTLTPRDAAPPVSAGSGTILAVAQAPVAPTSAVPPVAIVGQGAQAIPVPTVAANQVSGAQQAAAKVQSVAVASTVVAVKTTAAKAVAAVAAAVAAIAKPKAAAPAKPNTTVNPNYR
jgi:hypothetical protein